MSQSTPDDRRLRQDPGWRRREGASTGRGRSWLGARALLVLLGAIALIGMPVLPALALVGTVDTAGASNGVLVRVDGDAQVGPSESLGVVVVVQGDVVVEGAADVVVVVDGTAMLEGATVGTLVVVGGDAVLTDGTVVKGDVVLPNSTVSDDGSVRIDGDIVQDFDLAAFQRAISVVNVVLAIGGALLTLVAALAFAAVAPGTATSAVRALRADPGRVALSGLVFWIALPLLAVALLLTVIGAPTAFAVWFLVLPAVGFAGYLVTGVWLGQLLVDRRGEQFHPYGPALLGTAILVGVGFIPYLGAVVALIASVVGGSALALRAWTSLRSSRPIPASAR